MLSRTLPALLLALPALVPARQDQALPPREPAPLEPLELEGIRPVTRVGRVLLAGQPSPDALAGLAADGATVVVDLRLAEEPRGYDEPALAAELGLRYVPLGFGGAAPPTDELFAHVRRLLAEHEREGEGDLVLHCGSSVRVGAVWLAARALDERVPLATALEEARAVGLRSPGLEATARDYVVGGGHGALGALARELAAKRPGVATVDVTTLAAELEREGPPPVLLDVREPAEFAVSRLPGARRARTLEDARAALGSRPKDAPVVAYCSVGARSGELAAALAEAGYTNVRNLSGSVFAWANAGLPLEREPGAPRVVHPYDATWGRYLLPELRADLEER